MGGGVGGKIVGEVRGREVVEELEEGGRGKRGW